MAVLIEALSVVIRCKAIVKNYYGGVDAFMSALPNKTLCSDGELACVNFMVPKDVQAYVEYLISNGLTFKQSDEAIDIVVVDQMRGMTTDCDWADIGEADWNNNPNHVIVVCCARPTKVDRIVVPEGWGYEESLSANCKYVDGKQVPKNLKFVRIENGVDVLLDEKTGQEFYVRRG
ncbi:hypothetical protein [Microbulbifer rhizosphaerae]|uniref:Uncharacterized protein n=1 Tax=Microbulbifer rhizosphaerae TaxID=1562603 RepID=A0A7W4ZCQ6_9GAMM|nr:hypothetical protein [Microbulbifer rhizosphaerae]MBB3063674.1 hypothetical protein [Microbulbifer rhizosphaerae]